MVSSSKPTITLVAIMAILRETFSAKMPQFLTDLEKFLICSNDSFQESGSHIYCLRTSANFKSSSSEERFRAMIMPDASSSTFEGIALIP